MVTYVKPSTGPHHVVVAAFERWGCTDGDEWLVADPIHFEAVNVAPAR
jgi:hypothetical protein